MPLVAWPVTRPAQDKELVRADKPASWVVHPVVVQRATAALFW
jgi:hypothetical protein